MLKRIRHQNKIPTPFPLRLHPAWLPAAPPLEFHQSLRIHGSSFRRTQLRASLLLPLSRHRQTRDPRPRRRRNFCIFAIHERRDLGTGEATGKHCHRNKCRRVRYRCLLRQEIWGSDHPLEQQQGVHGIGYVTSQFPDPF